MSRITIAHIINPYTVQTGSEQYTAQTVTFETMKAAQTVAANNVNVELFAAFYPEDEAVIPNGFTKTRPLDRSILDIGEFNCTAQRKLPLLKDVLDRLYEKSAADYFIYTNVDIAVMPEFYTRIKTIIDQGYEGFVINRRTIRNHYNGLSDISRMIEEAGTKGEKHPGFDCFIFQRKAYKNYELREACIGANWIGRVLISNVTAFARKFKIFEDERLTFHLGDDRPWLGSGHDLYNWHNEKQLIAILDHIMTSTEIKNKKDIDQINEYFLNVCQSHENIPKNIVEINAPVYDLPDKPENVYHSEFRYSWTWEKLSTQRLRQDPIFIVGYPRSGTTLVQALIATQEKIYSFYETHFFSIARLPVTIKGVGIIPECLDMVIQKIRERIAFSKNAEEHVRKLAQAGILSTKMLFEILVIDNLLEKVSLSDMPHVRWMEKTPAHAQHLDIIHQFYPSAKIIHVVRRPEKAIVSRRIHFTFNMEAEWPIEKHIQKWLECVTAVENFNKFNPGIVMTVRLEDITHDTPGGMKKICDFLGIPLDISRLANHKQVSETLYYPWETWKSGAGKSISAAAAERKNYYLSYSDREKLYAMTGEGLRRYGYGPPSRSLAHIACHSASKSVSLIKKSAHRLNDSFFQLFKTPKGKINMTGQWDHFYGQHRSGWKFAVHCLKELHNPKGVRFDAFIERTFAWRPNEVNPHMEPWIGFIHIPPNIPDWFQGYQSNDNIFKTDAWKQSAPFCKGLYTLSDYHRRSLQAKIDIPVNNLLFPTETPEIKWSWEGFEANKEKKVIQVGWWLRKIHSIFQLPCGNYKKVFLKVNYFNWDDLIQKEREILKNEGTFRDEMLYSTETVTFLPDHEYDRMLSENIIFLHLYDSSANNTIIECIARNTPILVNPLESVVEYLGEHYPYYFNSLEEAAQKAADFDLIYRTHLYLVNHPIKEKLTGDYFLKSFIESENYQNLPGIRR